MYDIAIIGGGLSGLSCAIQLSRAGLSVVLIEKKQYPFHRVCGEYISMEALPFLKSQLQFDPFEHGAVAIEKLQVSSPTGKTIDLNLDLGGFGLSRHRLDDVLQQIATTNGVTIFQKTNVLSIKKHNSHFEIESNKNEPIKAKMTIGAFGKRSNLDRSLERNSFYHRSPYIGVKHHIRLPNFMPSDQIALHNFEEGYCGISRVEDDIFACVICLIAKILSKQKPFLSSKKPSFKKIQYFIAFLTKLHSCGKIHWLSMK